MEHWKIVDNAPKYEVSNLGRVRKRENGQILHQTTDGSGYKTVTIFFGGEWTTKGVHRLVATAFIRSPKDKEQVNHKDGVKDNNSIENLEWVTPSENIQHSYRVLGRKIAIRQKTQEGGNRMRLNLKLLRISMKLSQEEFAEKLNVSRAVYSNIERGKTNPSHKFWVNLQNVFNLPDEEMYGLQKKED